MLRECCVMARLNWFRTDSNWYSNPKFLMLRADKKWHAIYVYWAALGWTAAQGQHGFIPVYALPEFGGSPKDAEELVEVRLWELCEGGWQIRNYLDRQPGAEESEARSERAKKAAKARWAKHNASKVTGDLRIV
jgi:hypothetical protein